MDVVIGINEEQRALYARCDELWRVAKASGAWADWAAWDRADREWRDAIVRNAVRGGAR